MKDFFVVLDNKGMIFLLFNRRFVWIYLACRQRNQCTSAEAAKADIRAHPNHDTFMDQSDKEVKLRWQFVVFGFSNFQILISSMSMLFACVFVAQ